MESGRSIVSILSNMSYDSTYHYDERLFLLWSLRELWRRGITELVFVRRVRDWRNSLGAEYVLSKEEGQSLIFLEGSRACM